MDHDKLVEALKEPTAYDHPVDRVDYLQTHISSVFLTGERVYKLKKPVDFGFLNFTTLELREKYCREELRLNSRLAPSVYLGVEPVTEADGRIRVGGQGRTVDWVVVMRQMDGDQLGPAVLARGEVGPDKIDALVDILVPFYQEAATGEGIDEFGRIETVKFNTDENFAQTEAYVDICLSAERFTEIKAFTDSFYAEGADLFQRRIAQGRIRECHGDLHLANICFEQPPIIFDGIEFNDRFRNSDVAADLAFLAMDLDFNGLPDLAERLISHYIDQSGDAELAELIDFYKCYRAYVRGKIHAFTFDDAGVRSQAKAANLALAKRYFALAHQYAGGPARPNLFVFHGLMGTGKSALARWLFGRTGWPLIQTDVVRKRLAGLPEKSNVAESFNQGLYSPEMSSRTYEEMFRLAGDFLAAGQSVLLDASFKETRWRDRAVDLAERTGARPVFVKTVCDREEQRQRLTRRWDKGEVSDGRVDLMDAQAADYAPPGRAEAGRGLVISTERPKKETRREFARWLAEEGLID